MIEPIRLAFDVDAPPAHAFDVWASRISFTAAPMAAIIAAIVK